MDEMVLIERMESHGVKPTAMRLLVLRALTESGQTLTLRDLEDTLYPADRSTIFRALTLFQEKHLVHCIEDGTGSTRYEMCTGEHHCSIGDQHIHFHCTRCGRTLCLSHLPVPAVNLPEGYVSESINCVVSGLCPDCSAR